jgi:hypothetical protein
MAYKASSPLYTGSSSRTNPPHLRRFGYRFLRLLPGLLQQLSFELSYFRYLTQQL